MFAHDGMPVEQMVFRPPDGHFGNGKPIGQCFRIGWPDQLDQRLPLLLGDLAGPKPFKLRQFNAGDFPASFSLGNLGA